MKTHMCSTIIIYNNNTHTRAQTPTHTKPTKRFRLNRQTYIQHIYAARTKNREGVSHDSLHLKTPLGVQVVATSRISLRICTEYIGTSVCGGGVRLWGVFATTARHRRHYIQYIYITKSISIIVTAEEE